MLRASAAPALRGARHSHSARAVASTSRQSFVSSVAAWQQLRARQMHGEEID
jgi:hypothetical protein